MNNVQEKRPFTRSEIAFVALVFSFGLAARWWFATELYLNPDEAEHALISFQPWPALFSDAMWVSHPPLLLLLTHVVSWFGRGELAVRMIPLLAGSLFPLAIYLWLRRIAGSAAAMGALLLLTAAPHLAGLSAQLRSYTPALFFLATALWSFDAAIDRGRASLMMVFNILLWLCIFSDYSMAWFAGAVFVYAILRLRGSPATLRWVWVTGQAGAIAIYAWLYVIQVRAFNTSAMRDEAVSGWLVDSFPHRRNLFRFPIANTVKQFTYLLDSHRLGVLAAVLCGIALILLWTGRAGIPLTRSRALALLIAIPFALAILGAYAHEFPYGQSRQSVVTGVFGAFGLSILLVRIPARAATAILWIMLLAVPLWYRRFEGEPPGLARSRKTQLLECLSYMNANIPPGTKILSERQALYVFGYYGGLREHPEWAGILYFAETDVSGWRIFTRDYGYDQPQKLLSALADLRRQFGWNAAEPVWILDGGFNAATPADPHLPFTQAFRIYRATQP